MATHRNRVSSPPPRVYLENPRASTGAALGSSFDTRFGQAPRASFSSIASARDSVSSARNSMYETQPVRKSVYADQTNPGGAVTRTEYAIRPRRESQSENRRPLNVVTKNPSPTRDYPTVSDAPREVGNLKAQPRDDSSSRYLQPAHATHHNHHRHNSATRAELDRYHMNVPREYRQKAYHQPSGPYVEKVYTSSRPAAVPKYLDDEYSYTGPREQFARDYPARPPRRNSLTRKERPSSAIDPEFKQVPWKRERDNGPPPAAARQLERIEQPDSSKYVRSGFDSDPERSSEAPRRRHSTKAPILHQHRDEGYSSSRDEHGSRRPSKNREPIYEDEMTVAKGRLREPSKDFNYEKERERDKVYRKEYDRDRDRTYERERNRERLPERERDRERHTERERERDRDRDRERPRDYEHYDRDTEPRKQPRSREASPDHSGIKGLAAATGLGGIAAAALVSRKGRKDDEDSESDSRRERKHRHHRSREATDDTEAYPEEGAELDRRGHHERHRRHANESSGSDTPEDQPSHERRSSKRRHRREADEEEANATRAQMPIVEPDENEHYEAEQAYENHQGVPRQQNESPTNLEGRTLSPGEGEDGRPRRVQLVEPVKDNLASRPKGILKPPRAVPFPEDPNPTREGVAPLKAAGKDGIPTSARWTKINRMLVNPEALEKSHERFEERDDYVVVLRVLSREDIEKLAEKTKEIRETRERIWQQQLDERRRRKAEREQGDEEAPPQHDEVEEEPQMAIEAPPAPPVDLRNLQGQNASDTERILAGGVPVPDITVEHEHSNYSENV